MEILRVGTVDDADAAAVDKNQFLGYERCQRAYRVRGGHVRQVGKVLAAHVDLERGVVALVAVIVGKKKQRLGQTSADMFLRKVDYLGVGSAKVARQARG